MKNQINPWLASNVWLLVIAMLPAFLLLAALIYFTAWAFSFSFTDLELVGRKSVDWSWVGFENDRKSTRLNSSHSRASRMPSSA